MDPTLTRADRLVGQVLGEVGALPEVYTELEINFFLLRRLLGVRTEVPAQHYGCFGSRLSATASPCKGRPSILPCSDNRKTSVLGQASTRTTKTQQKYTG